MKFIEALTATRKHPSKQCVIYRKDCDALFARITDTGEIEFSRACNPYLADLLEFEDWEVEAQEG